VVVPVIYTYLDDLAFWLKRKLGSAPQSANGDATTKLPL
jgi:hypothetical protein